MQLDQDVRLEDGRSRVPGALLAACSLIVPGAGQMLARRWVRGVLMLVAVALAAAAAVAYLREPVARLAGGRHRPAARC